MRGQEDVELIKGAREGAQRAILEGTKVVGDGRENLPIETLAPAGAETRGSITGEVGNSPEDVGEGEKFRPQARSLWYNPREYH